VELLLRPGNVCGAEELKRHVEIEINPGPPLELSRVDDPQPGVDADSPEAGDESQNHILEVRTPGDDLD